MRSLSLVIATLALVSLVPRLTLAGTICPSAPPGTTTWTDGNSNWSNGSNWNSGVPNGATNACITDGASTVALDTSLGYVASLQVNSGNTLRFNQGASLTVYGPQLVNAGAIQVNGGGNRNTYLYAPSNITLSGAGTLTLSTTTSGGGGNAWLYMYNGATLDNIDNTIQGEGIIYNSGTTLNNHAGNVINANSTGSPLVDTLAVQYGTVNNQGVMEATNNGVLQLQNTTVNNTGGGIIAANGSSASVNLYNSTILGGTLNNNGGAFFGTPTGYSATLDGSTGAGAITLNGGYTSDFSTNTYLYGTINNNNNLQVNGGANTNTYLSLNGGTLTLTGGGTLSLYTTTSGGGGNAYLYLFNGATLDNIDNTIQGEGIIYNSGTTLNNHAGNVINANSTGSPLVDTLAVQYGTVNNQGVMEATNNGVLQLQNTTVNNTGGGIIAANGPGASVKLYNTTIQGGTLDNNGGAFFGTPAGNTDYLDGSAAGPLTLKGTYTADFSSNTYLYGTINNQGDLVVNGGGNTNTYLYAPSDVTLTGGGTVSLNTTTSGGGGNAWLYMYNGATLDNVNNTIQGEGTIYNSGTTLINEAGGTILADSTGSPLIDTMYIDYGTVANHGTMRVDDGGTMDLYHVAFTTDGNVTINSGGDFVIDTTYSQTGGTTRVDGTLTANAGVNVVGGTVDGTGTIIGGVSLTDATMQPGDAPGTLTIVGDYSMTGGEFVELIDGVSNGLLSVSGTLTFGPGVNLDIDLLPGFTAVIGQQFTILEFLLRSGTFANTPGGIFDESGYEWSVAYNANNVVLTLDSESQSSVPEPSSLILMATALGSILASGKLRRAKR